MKHARKRRARERLRATWVAIATAVTTLLAVHPLHAEDDGAHPIEGYVVRVDDGDVIVDVAAGQGAKAGDELELWRPLELRHPVSNKIVRDRFVIGRLRLRKVRDRLAVAEAIQWERAPEPGDVVVLRRASDDRDKQASPEPTTSPSPRQRAVKPKKRKMSEAQRVAAMFASLSGSSLQKRIAAYGEWIRKRPHSRYTPVLREEQAMLRSLARYQHGDGEMTGIDLIEHQSPGRALSGLPLAIAILVRGRPEVAVLHVRRRGESGYATSAMTPAGPGYYRAMLAPSQVASPGVEYFVETVARDGSTHELLGSAEAPLGFDVDDVPAPQAPEPPLITVAAWSDYADYNRLRGNDVAWQTEGYFEMRLGDVGARALRSGFGVYRGVGGSLTALDELGKSPRLIGLTYGYLEGEVGFTDFVGLAGRGVVGLVSGGITGGAQAFVRIGNDLRTNLLLGGEFLGGVGLRGMAELQLRVFEDWPMAFRTEVSNQPAGTAAEPEEVRPKIDGTPPENTSTGRNSVGGRGIVQVGYRIVDTLVVSVRGSYQGRNIKHSGPGLGGGISYTW